VKCDLCDQEATVHETQIVNGQIVGRHLCERHAAEEGLVTAQGETSAVALVSVQASSLASGSAALACERCGLSYAAFRRHGLLGCSGCYEAFCEKLSPLIERAHQGGTHHIGKTPRRMLASVAASDREAIERLLGGARERAERAAQLRKQLEEAVAREEYERAAALRDELRRVGQQADGPDTAGDPGGQAETGGDGPGGPSGRADGGDDP